jgi:hypothetical protein
MTRIMIAVLVMLPMTHPAMASHPGDITGTYPTTDFPTGLAWDGSHIWLADRDCEWLYAIDAKSGVPVDSVASPAFSPLGLAFGDGCLWVSGYDEDVIYKLDITTRQVVDAISAPSSVTSGLAWQDGYLWACDAAEKKIVRLDPRDGTPMRSIEAPSRYPGGLAWDGHYLWVSDRRKDEIYMVEPEHGWVVLTFASPGPYPRGLTWDGEHLWNVDYQTDSLYVLRCDGDENKALGSSKKAVVRFTFKIRCGGPGPLDKCDVYLALPHDDLEHQSLLSDPVFVPRPADFVKDRWGQEFAHLTVAGLQPGETARLSYEVPVEMQAQQYILIPEEVGGLSRIPRDVKARYTVDGARLQLDDPVIQNAVKEAVGDEDNPYWMIRSILEYIGDRIDYERVGGWDTAPNVLKRGTGSCSEYSFVLMAMARAAGIPTRFCAGVCERGDEASMDDVFHRWTEVYLPNYGWVPMDADAHDMEWQADCAKAIGSRSNRILVTTIGGGDSEYVGWGYNYGYFPTYSGRTSIDVSTYADWEAID